MTQSSGSDIGHLIAQLGRLETAIGKEFSLIGDRMTWLVISQSFLLAAFVGSTVNYDTAISTKHVLRAFQLMMPTFGILVAFLLILAIKAAHSATDMLKTQRDRLENRLPEHLRITLIGVTMWEHDRGNWPPVVIPYAVLLVWAILLVVVVASVV